MELTKEQAIALHRKLWSWVALKTEEEQRRVLKEECPIFDDLNEYITNHCFLCEYVNNTAGYCDDCPLEWPSQMCSDATSIYTQWRRCTDIKKRAELAWEIANLPERQGK